MEWVLIRRVRGGHWMTLIDDKGKSVAKYTHDVDKYLVLYRVAYTGVGHSELIPYEGTTEDELQTYIKHKYLLLRGET